MGLGEAFFSLAVIGAVVSWVMAAVRGHQHGGSKGVTYFFIHLLSAVATITLLWWIIVKPQLHCAGFLCGLEYVLLWLVLSMLLSLIWPLIVIQLIKRKWPERIKPILKSEDVLDDTDELLDDSI